MTNPARFTRRWFLRIAVFLTSILLSVYSLHWLPRVTHGFTMYYTYARMVLDGDDFRRAYDFDYFNAKVRAVGISDIIDMPNNPPTTALAMLPVAWLSPVPAKIVWGVFSLICLAISLHVLFDINDIRLDSPLGLGLLVLIFVWKPLYENIALGQLYLVLLLLFSLSLLGLKRSRHMLTAFPVSASVMLKGYGILPLLWFGLRKQWNVARVILLGMIIIVALLAPVFTPGVWWTFLEKVGVSLGRNPSDAHVTYQSINGLLRHLFLYDQRWSPSPLFSISEIPLASASMLLNLLVMVLVVRYSSGPGDEDALLSYSTLIAASVITTPLAEEYHYVLFLPLVIGLAARFFRLTSSPRDVGMSGFLFITSVLVMALPLQYKELNASAFPVILLAYPKLFAGSVMIFVCSLQKYSSSPTTA